MGSCDHRRKINAGVVLLFVMQAALTIAWADPSLPHLISDHAVFQQGREIHIWGTADASEAIKVSLSAQTATATADGAGRWSVMLPPMAAGGPFTLKVEGKKTLIIKDVLIGEVWVASGQSNMTFSLSGSDGAAEELPKADYSEIHLFTVPKRVSGFPQADTLAASWAPCTPETAKEFSAVAYYFARELHRKLNVPIGIIESAWPGTAIEEWIAPEAAQKDPQIQPMLDRWNKSEGELSAVGRKPFDLEFDDFELLPDPAHSDAPFVLSNFDDGTARNAFGGYWYYDAKEAPETLFDLSAPGHSDKGFAAHIAGRMDAADDVRLHLRFHQDSSPADLSKFAGVRFWVRGQGMFRFFSIQPTIYDWDDYGTPKLRASNEWTPVTIWFHDLRQDGWGVPHEFTPQSLTGFVIVGLPAAGDPALPASSIYEGMITPLLPYAFRGVIWYQGESNGLRGIEYRRLLPDLIQSWRTASNQPNLQFGIVQLPNHGAIPVQPSESGWAEVREAEWMTARTVANTGLAVTIDVGDPNDLHPHRKAEVGERLALWALGSTYHQPIVYSGPVYEGMSIENRQIRIRFSSIGAGLVAQGGGALRGFAIAGKDHKFHWASALIDKTPNGSSVVVSSPEVPDPVAVRYAWGDSPDCNLFNSEGLPASPFRTDDWPRAGEK
jgi:sialate O-acetylesterase